jgi:hypothetical protein
MVLARFGYYLARLLWLLVYLARLLEMTQNQFVDGSVIDIEMRRK